MAFTATARPVIWALGRIANQALVRMDIKSQEEISSVRFASELAAPVERSIEGGTFDMSMADLSVNAIRMSAPSATGVMTDRGCLHTLNEDDSAQDVLGLARETGHSRFPVTGDDSGNVLDLASLRHTVAVSTNCRAEVPVISPSLVTDTPSTPETVPIGPLMIQLHDEDLQMTVAIDGYGGMSGIVTLEDVAEEITNKISGEHGRRRLGIRPRLDGTFPVPDTLHPDELARYTDVNLPEDGPYDMIDGLVMNGLGEIPVAGSRVNMDDVGIEITQIQERHVAQMAITLAPEAKDERVLL